jgi:hypothetical protein
MTHNHWHSIANHDSQSLAHCESWCVMLSQWLWIMVCYTDPVVVNHVCYTEANSCESCCFILSRLCLSYGVSCRAVGYEWYYNTPWFTTTGSTLHTMTHNYWLSITHHDSQPLAQHYTPSITTTCSALHTIEPIVFELWCVMPSSWLWMIWVSGCELWCILLDQWSWVLNITNHD